MFGYWSTVHDSVFIETKVLFHLFLGLNIVLHYSMTLGPGGRWWSRSPRSPGPQGRRPGRTGRSGQLAVEARVGSDLDHGRHWDNPAAFRRTRTTAARMTGYYICEYGEPAPTLPISHPCLHQTTLMRPTTPAPIMAAEKSF